jgi:deoxycytidylate deaminase
MEYTDTTDGNMKQHNITAFVYDKRNRLLSVGNNSYVKTHTIQARYAAKAGNPARIYLHAEIDALIKASRKGVPHKIVVIRYKANGEQALARPCDACMLAIKEYGVKIVEYST